MYPGTTGQNTGVISTQNIGAPNGNAVTALSTVSAVLGGLYDTAAIQVVGAYTGVLSVQVQLDNGTWVTLTGAQSITNAVSGAQSATIASAAQGVWQLDVSGFFGVRVTALAAVTGSATVTIIGAPGSGVMGIDTPITISGTVTTTPATAGDFALTSAATTNATLVKSTTGNLFEVTGDNVGAADAWLKLYRKATAPTVGTDVPIYTKKIPLTGDVNLEFGALGKKFSTGIGYAVTGAQAVADTTVLAAGQVHLHGTFI